MRYFLSHKASMTGPPTRTETRDREGGPENTADLSGMVNTGMIQYWNPYSW